MKNGTCETCGVPVSVEQGERLLCMEHYFSEELSDLDAAATKAVAEDGQRPADMAIASDDVLKENIIQFFHALLIAHGGDVSEERWHSATWELIDKAAADGIPPSRAWRVICSATTGGPPVPPPRA